MLAHPLVYRRTFEAKKYPKGSAERARLNGSPLTSEYRPFRRYVVRSLNLMDDGTEHPTQPFSHDTYRTRAEAEARAALARGDK